MADTDWVYLLKWIEIHVPECSIAPLPCLLCDLFWSILISLHVKGQNSYLHAKYIIVCSRFQSPAQNLISKSSARNCLQVQNRHTNQ